MDTTQAGWPAVLRKLDENKRMTYDEIVEFLTHDYETGEYTGDLHVPVGRYGSSGLDCARVAASIAVAEGNTTCGDRPTMQYLMYLTVNSADDIAFLLNQAGLCVSATPVELLAERE